MTAESDLSKKWNRLANAMEKAVQQRTLSKRPKLEPLPPDLAALYCPVCEKFMASSGCLDHPRQEKLL